MKKVKIAIVVATLAIAHCMKADDVQWISKVYDFGAFGEDEPIKPAEFKFVNTTSQPISIISASATCGCTTPQYSRDSIAPGDTAIIKASYNPEGRPGRFSKQVYVRTSASHTRHRLELKGVVIGNNNSVSKRYPVDMGPLKLRNGAIMIGKVAKDKSKSEFIDGYNQSEMTLSPTFANVPQYVEISAIPSEVPAGELVSFNIYFRGDKCKTWGVVNDSLQICPQGKEGSCFWIPLVAIVEEDFSNLTDAQRAQAPVLTLDTDKIDLGNVPNNSTEPIKATLKIFNTGKETLKLRRVYSQDPDLVVKVKNEAIKPGKDGEIEVIYNPSSQPYGVINTRLSIISNDPAAPTRTVRVVGTRDN